MGWGDSPFCGESASVGGLAVFFIFFPAASLGLVDFHALIKAEEVGYWLVLVVLIRSRCSVIGTLTDKLRHYIWKYLTFPLSIN